MKISPIHTFQVGNSFPEDSPVYGHFPLSVENGFIVFRVTSKIGQESYGLLTMLYPKDANEIRPHEDVILGKVASTEEQAINETTYRKPVCLLHKPDPELSDLLVTGFEKGKIITHFYEGSVLYEYAIIDEKEWAQKVIDRFSTFENLVIADGHHRTAAYFALRSNVMQDPGLYSAILSLDQVRVKSYHRILHIEQDQRAAFFTILEQYFTINDYAERDGDTLIGQHNLKQKSVFLCNQKQWKKLNPSTDHISVRKGSADLLTLFHDKVLNKFCDDHGKMIYEITRFVSGDELESDQLKISPNEYIFLFPPVSREFLWFSSNEGEVLPAKSTWIEPRIPSNVIEVPNIL